MAVKKKGVRTRLRGDKRDFEDHFSRRASVYVRYRPTYPDALYSYLASIAPHRRLAWDCGTGNGQAALGLARHFDHVIATDASAEQLALAPRNGRVEYRVARSESSGLESHSVALATSAVAVHWYELDRFYAEVRRVLTPGGVIAVWCYSAPTTEPAIDRIIERYLREILDGCWPERFHFVLERYRTLPFPFEEEAPPCFSMETTWTLTKLLGFLRSWSGTARYEEQKGKNPLDLIRPELKRAWGVTARKRLLRWDLHLRLGRV